MPKPSHPGRLESKTAVVTGGASGFGAGIVTKFIEEGANVVVVDVNAEVGEEFVRSLGGFGGEKGASNNGDDDVGGDGKGKVVGGKGEGARAVFCRADVTSEEDWGRIVDVAKREFGGLGIVVNNAVS